MGKVVEIAALMCCVMIAEVYVMGNVRGIFARVVIPSLLIIHSTHLLIIQERTGCIYCVEMSSRTALVCKHNFMREGELMVLINNNISECGNTVCVGCYVRCDAKPCPKLFCYQCDALQYCVNCDIYAYCKEHQTTDCLYCYINNI